MSKCIIFIGERDSWGYGRFRVNGKYKKAHRMEWIKHKGPIPNGLLVLHTCDNPPCINIDHLFLGTNKDNMDDKVSKDRQYKKITDEQVDQIRDLYEYDKLSQQEIANMYNIGQVQVSRIIRFERRIK